MNKRTKSTVLNPTPSPRDIEAGGSFAGIDMPFKQVAAFETLVSTTGDEEFTAAGKVISIGLFVLGLDPAGDYCLPEITNALFGKDSDLSADVYNSIVDAGSHSHDARTNLERVQRSSVQVEAVSS